MQHSCRENKRKAPLPPAEAREEGPTWLERAGRPEQEHSDQDHQESPNRPCYTRTRGVTFFHGGHSKLSPRDCYSRGVRLLSSRLRPFGTANAGLGERNPWHFCEACLSAEEQKPLPKKRFLGTSRSSAVVSLPERKSHRMTERTHASMPFVEGFFGIGGTSTCRSQLSTAVPFFARFLRVPSPGRQEDLATSRPHEKNRERRRIVPLRPSDLRESDLFKITRYKTALQKPQICGF